MSSFFYYCYMCVTEILKCLMCFSVTKYHITNTLSLFYTETLLQYVCCKTERKVMNNSLFIEVFGYAEECVSVGVTC
jgi:hypothetical protein